MFYNIPSKFYAEKFRLINLNPRKLRISMSCLFYCEILILETYDGYDEFTVTRILSVSYHQLIFVERQYCVTLVLT